MRMSETIGQLATALAKAQGQMEDASKDATNPHFRSKYADLAAVRSVVRGPLAANDLSVIQAPRSREGEVEVETMLLHKSGEFISESLAVPLSKRDAQGVGSAISYARRYGLMAILGIAADDDDGNAAVENTPNRQPAPRQPATAPMREPEGPTESQLACQTAIVNRFLAAPTTAAIDADWKWAVEQMNAVGIAKGSDIYGAVLESFKDCKIALQDRERPSEAAE